MKYFEFFLITGISILFLCIHLVKNREEFTDETTTDETKKYDPTFYSSDYHASEETIREQNDHKLNVFYVKGTDNNSIPVYFESTQSFPTYETPGTYKYGTSNYVPVYEDAIKLSKANIERKYMIHSGTAEYNDKKEVK
jgi:hypothetical protein